MNRTHKNRDYITDIKQILELKDNRDIRGEKYKENGQTKFKAYVSPRAPSIWSRITGTRAQKKAMGKIALKKLAVDNAARKDTQNPSEALEANKRLAQHDILYRSIQQLSGKHAVRREHVAKAYEAVNPKKPASVQPSPGAAKNVSTPAQRSGAIDASAPKADLADVKIHDCLNLISNVEKAALDEKVDALGQAIADGNNGKIQTLMTDLVTQEIAPRCGDALDHVDTFKAAMKNSINAAMSRKTMSHKAMSHKAMSHKAISGRTQLEDKRRQGRVENRLNVEANFFGEAWDKLQAARPKTARPPNDLIDDTSSEQDFERSDEPAVIAGPDRLLIEEDSTSESEGEYLGEWEKAPEGELEANAGPDESADALHEEATQLSLLGKGVSPDDLIMALEQAPTASSAAKSVKAAVTPKNVSATRQVSFADDLERVTSFKVGDRPSQVSADGNRALEDVMIAEVRGGADIKTTCSRIGQAILRNELTEENVDKVIDVLREAFSRPGLDAPSDGAEFNTKLINDITAGIPDRNGRRKIMTFLDEHHVSRAVFTGFKTARSRNASVGVPPRPRTGPPTGGAPRELVPVDDDDFDAKQPALPKRPLSRRPREAGPNWPTVGVPQSRPQQIRSQVLDAQATEVPLPRGGTKTLYSANFGGVVYKPAPPEECYSGKGGLAQVFKYVDDKGNPIAVKIWIDESKESTLAAEREARLHEKASIGLDGAPNPEVLRFVGVAATKEGEIYHAMEYMPNGDLKDIFGVTDYGVIDGTISKQHADIIGMTGSKDAARVLARLHHENLLHRDFKAENLLIGEDVTAKGADFGASAEGISSPLADLPVDAPQTNAVEVLYQTIMLEKYGKMLRENLENTKHEVTQEFMKSANVTFKQAKTAVSNITKIKEQEEEIEQKIKAYRDSQTTDQKSDIWSLGIVCAGSMRLRGFVNAKFAITMKERLERYAGGVGIPAIAPPGMKADADGKLPNGSLFESTEIDALDVLLNRMFDRDPKNRPTADEVVNDPIFTDPRIGAPETRELMRAILPARTAAEKRRNAEADLEPKEKDVARYKENLEAATKARDKKSIAICQQQLASAQRTVDLRMKEINEAKQAMMAATPNLTAAKVAFDDAFD